MEEVVVQVLLWVSNEMQQVDHWSTSTPQSIEHSHTSRRHRLASTIEVAYCGNSLTKVHFTPNCVVLEIITIQLLWFIHS